MIQELERSIQKKSDEVILTITNGDPYATCKRAITSSSHNSRHRTRASHSQGTVLVWPWPSAPRLAAQGGMGNGTRIEQGREVQKPANFTTVSLDAPEPFTPNEPFFR
jgi:hypothetical protein